MPPQPPPNFNATPSTLISETHSIISNTRTLQNKIITSIHPQNATFTNVLLPLALDENECLRKRKIIKFYSSTSSSAELREASNVSEGLFVEFDSWTLMREDLFLLVDAVLKRNEDLDEESKFYLECKHREFQRNGMGIKDVEKRDRFIKVKKELHEKTVAARKSLNASAGIWFTRSELDGLPENILNGLKIGDCENDGKLWLPLKKPHLETALKYACNAATRRRVYVGNDNRCMDNVPRYREIVLLRDEAARLLGYRNHADFQLEVKMAESVDFVNDFIGDLRERLTPVAKMQLQALKYIKMNDGANIGKEKNDTFYIWDYGFYANLSNVQTNSFDEKKFSEYFSLERSLSGMMDTFSKLFGLQFQYILPEQYSNFGVDHVMTWHESVSVYSVWADDVGDANDFVGYLYLDLFPRENKYNHAGHYLLQPGYIAEDGKYCYPSSALVMNIPAPQPLKPTLLSHDTIRSLFHELGHAMHNLLSRTQFAFFHGTATTRDFVEIPSIMLENWWWTPSVIKELGYHYSYLSDEMLSAWEASDGKPEERASEKLDDEIIHNLVNSRRTNEALATLKQCHLAMFDMAIHSPSSREAAEAMNLPQMWNQMLREITLMSGLEVEDGGWEWGHGYSRFGLLVRGYDAGYYAYPLGKAYAQDLFTSMFQKNPMSRKVGLKYQKAVLEKGASRNGMELLEDFLGRKPNAVARYKELGLV